MQPTRAKAAAMSSSSGTDADDARSSKVSGEAGGCGPVVELPFHLTEKIIYSISPLASARLATVCKSWAAAVSERLARPVPHLFVYLPPDNKSDRRGVVVSVPMDSGGPPAEVIPNRVRLADTNGLRCIGAMPSGCLAFANWCWWDTGVLLVNPITGARRRLDVERLCRDPVIAAGGAADSFISIGTDKLVLWWRAGGGEEWSKWTVAAPAAAHRTDGIMSVVNCNGRFYILDRDGQVSLIDATAPPPLLIEKLPVVSLCEQFPTLATATATGHLLESDGEVLFVRRVLASMEHRGVLFCTHDITENLSIVGFEVYRLDVKERRWTEVKKLAGDRALFVSPVSSFSVRSSETEGCSRNCIYFVDKKRYCSSCLRDDGNTWGVYSMEDREVLFKHAVTAPGPCSSATWFLPRVV
ncbi:hypothetical protein PAHAL_1G112300 [Panicum hallii]|jgi:hypothetical protein|uniref:KIB1-4 beta-propeller domain-containing protein n=1 Tax=Panicum hallii TaxID=206008 RepID=A0A2T8KUZ4_9POAL|nr:uncharacterized protein LOC112878972 [Panicum hallii]PVH65959.1 hypothetical protein PAHAL_1G112300 [Panicum hallii]